MAPLGCMCGGGLPSVPDLLPCFGVNLSCLLTPPSPRPAPPHPAPSQVGLDFSTLAEGLLASSGWDELTYVWNMNQDPRAQ